MTKKVDLQELLIYVNGNYVDDRLYLIVPHLYEKRDYEILWSRDLNEPRWLVREKGSSDFEYVSTEELVKALNVRKINLIEFHIELINKVLIHIAHLTIILDRSEQLFGKDIIDQAYDSLKKYYVDLQAAIEQIIVPSKKPKAKPKSKLKMVEKEKE